MSIRVVIIKRKNGIYNLRYVKVGKFDGMTNKEKERIDAEGDWSSITYIHTALEQDKLKKIYDIINGD